MEAAARSKAWVCGRSLARIAGSNAVSETGRSLVQRIHTECGVPERDREASRRACCAMDIHQQSDERLRQKHTSLLTS